MDVIKDLEEFIKAIKRNVEEFQDDELTWKAKDEGFVIKKLRK